MCHRDRCGDQALSPRRISVRGRPAQGSVPNWPVQLAGTLILVMPLLLQRDQWQSDTFRVQFLCSALVYVVLFNHQAERQSYVFGATGSIIWFVTGPRKAERGVLLAVALLG